MSDALSDLAATETTTTEDPRVTRAREVLAESRAALDDMSRPYDPAGWAGRLQAAVELLLAYVDEQALTAECTCGATYETYGGPEPDCAVHGATPLRETS